MNIKKKTKKSNITTATKNCYLLCFQDDLVERLLGPKGVTLKRIQDETQTTIIIRGRGSMKDEKREEVLRNCTETRYEHLKDPLHIIIEANPPFSEAKLAAGKAEIEKMLILLVILYLKLYFVDFPFIIYLFFHTLSFYF